jgi:hypothetical protein
MPDIAVENAVRSVLTRIDAAWREKKFDGLEECFDDGAVIVGPNYAEYAVGGKACAESYRAWPDTAVYTFAWQMTYERENGPHREAGTDQLVLGRFGAHWRVLFRHIYFSPAG